MDLGRLTEIPGTIILRMLTESYIGITKDCSVYTGVVADDLDYLTKFLLTPAPHPKPSSSFRGYISCN
ncbi:hypothetical protein LEMLEM_LOCUS1412, partial [Lemmus lemmus]